MSAEELRATLERTVQELQRVSSQHAAISTQIAEIEQTMVLLETQDADRALYRQVGPVLAEVEDRAQLKTELEAGRVTFVEAATRAAEREAELREAYERIIQQIESV